MYTVVFGKSFKGSSLVDFVLSVSDGLMSQTQRDSQSTTLIVHVAGSFQQKVIYSVISHFYVNNGHCHLHSACVVFVLFFLRIEYIRISSLLGFLFYLLVIHGDY